MFTKKNDSRLLFFLGAGVSKPSGLPLAGEIDIFKDDLVWNGAIQRFGPPREVRDDGYSRGKADRVRKFLRVVEKRTQIYFDKQIQKSGGNTREVNYGDIYFLCERIKEHEKGNSRDPTLDSFAEIIRNHASEYLICDPEDKRGAGHPLHRKKTKLDYTSGLGMRLIISVIRRELDKDVEVEGFGALLGAVRSNEYDRIDIVTLNHDILIEKLFNIKGVELENGFKHYREELMVYQPDRIFEENVRVKLIKPHGSVSWYLSNQKGVIEHSGLESNAVYVSVNPPESADPYPTGVTDKYDIITSLPSLLSSSGKERDYGKNIYGDMTTAFQLSVRGADSIIVSGYGWSDDGMNDRLLAALNTGKVDRLTLLRDNSNSERVPSTVQYLLEQDQANLVDDWLCNVAWDELQQEIV